MKSTLYELFVDAYYSVGIIILVDSASIIIIVFAALDILNDVEILGITPFPTRFCCPNNKKCSIYNVLWLADIYDSRSCNGGYLLFKKRTCFSKIQYK